MDKGSDAAGVVATVILCVSLALCAFLVRGMGAGAAAEAGPATGEDDWDSRRRPLRRSAYSTVRVGGLVVTPSAIHRAPTLLSTFGMAANSKSFSI